MEDFAYSINFPSENLLSNVSLDCSSNTKGSFLATRQEGKLVESILQPEPKTKTVTSTSFDKPNSGQESTWALTCSQFLPYKSFKHQRARPSTFECTISFITAEEHSIITDDQEQRGRTDDLAEDHPVQADCTSANRGTASASTASSLVGVSKGAPKKARNGSGDTSLQISKKNASTGPFYTKSFTPPLSCKEAGEKENNWTNTLSDQAGLSEKIAGSVTLGAFGPSKNSEVARKKGPSHQKLTPCEKHISLGLFSPPPPQKHASFSRDKKCTTGIIKPVSVASPLMKALAHERKNIASPIMAVEKVVRAASQGGSLFKGFTGAPTSIASIASNLVDIRSLAFKAHPVKNFTQPMTLKMKKVAANQKNELPVPAALKGVKKVCNYSKNCSSKYTEEGPGCNLRPSSTHLSPKILSIVSCEDNSDMQKSFSLQLKKESSVSHVPSIYKETGAPSKSGQRNYTFVPEGRNFHIKPRLDPALSTRQ